MEENLFSVLFPLHLYFTMKNFLQFYLTNFDTIPLAF